MAEPQTAPLAVVGEALSGAAGQLDGSKGLREADLEKALEAELASRVDVSRQHPVKLDSWEGRLGPVDLSVQDESGLTLIEAKWGGGALWNCAWDVAKLATALAEGVADHGYLVAGASRAAWSEGVEGVELFDAGRWDADSLLSRFASRFAFWREDVANYPRQVARRWTVSEGLRAAMEVSGEPWEIRSVEITVDHPDLIRVVYVPHVVEA